MANTFPWGSVKVPRCWITQQCVLWTASRKRAMFSLRLSMKMYARSCKESFLTSHYRAHYWWMGRAVARFVPLTFDRACNERHSEVMRQLWNTSHRSRASSYWRTIIIWLQTLLMGWWVHHWEMRGERWFIDSFLDQRLGSKNEQECHSDGIP